MLEIWQISTKLLNIISKTKYTLISHNYISFDINLEIQNNILERVSTIKFLGLIIDKKLTSNHHIDFMHKKLTCCRYYIQVIPIYSFLYYINFIRKHYKKATCRFLNQVFLNLTSAITSLYLLFTKMYLLPMNWVIK